MKQEHNLSNPVFDTIRHRRSVRSYLSRPIPRYILTAIIEAGNMAPSGHNRQPWRFVVVENPEVKQKLLQITLPFDQAMLQRLQVTDPELYESIQKTVHASPEDPIYYSAPVILFVIGTGGGTERIDCPLVCQNMMLAAHSIGVGSCMVGAGRRGLADNPDVAHALKLTEDETIYPPIVLGYPKSRHTSPVKRQPQITWI